MSITDKYLPFLKRKYYEYKGRQYDREKGQIKKAREYEGMPDFDIKGNPTEGLKARTTADWVKAKYRTSSDGQMKK